MKIWACKIGEVEPDVLPSGADAPMREAVEKAYLELTGKENNFCFSGWGGKLDPGERIVVNEWADKANEQPEKDKS